MNIWIAGICACSLAVSLLLLLLLYRGRRLSPLGLAASSLLQLAIWAGAWLLYQPPHWSQAPDSAQITGGTQPAADDPRFFPRQLAALNWVAVTGDGLSRAALLVMPPVRLRANIDYPGPAWQVHWRRALSLGEKLEIQLRTDTPFAAPFTEKLQLLLRDPFGSEIDRREIASGDSSVRFALSTTPKLVGRWLYELEIQQGDQIRREVIPLVVSEDKKPAVLLWLARPSFETAALSRWLRQSGVPARILTQLAPDIVREESLNGFAPASGEPLDAGNNFDLLILDSHLWPSLTRGQKAQLQQLATRKSLLWLVGQDSTEEFLVYARAQQMPLQKLDLPQPVSAASSGASSDDSSGAPQLSPAGYQPQAVAAADLLLRNSGVPVYWGRSGGATTQGFVLFGQSYRWVTAGFHREYAELWKAIFDHQLALRGTQAPVLLEPQLPLAQQRVSLCSAASNSAAEIVRVDGEGDRAQVMAVRDPVDTDGSCVEFWPEEPGWYRLSSEKQIFEFYVFPQQAWPWWQRWTVRADTAQMADARLGPKLAGGAERLALPLQWIALLLIALLTITWWRERKM